MIGILNYIKQSNERTSYCTPHAMCYGGLSGYKHPEKVIEGQGFKRSNTVLVEVNRLTCKVTYWVNNTIEACQTNRMLAD